MRQLRRKALPGAWPGLASDSEETCSIESTSLAQTDAASARSSRLDSCSISSISSISEPSVWEEALEDLFVSSAESTKGKIGATSHFSGLFPHLFSAENAQHAKHLKNFRTSSDATAGSLSLQVPSSSECDSLFNVPSTTTSASSTVTHSLSCRDGPYKLGQRRRVRDSQQNWPSSPANRSSLRSDLSNDSQIHSQWQPNRSLKPLLLRPRHSLKQQPKANYGHARETLPAEDVSGSLSSVHHRCSWHTESTRPSEEHSSLSHRHQDSAQVTNIISHQGKKEVSPTLGQSSFEKIHINYLERYQHPTSVHLPTYANPQSYVLPELPPQCIDKPRESHILPSHAKISARKRLMSLFKRNKREPKPQ